MKSAPRLCLIFSFVLIYLSIFSINSIAGGRQHSPGTKKHNFAASSGGSSLAGRSALGLGAAYIDYAADDFRPDDIKIDVEPDDAVMTGLTFTYFHSDYFSLEVSVNYIKTDLDFSASGLSATAGELTQIPILLGGRFGLPLAEMFLPYIGGGLGCFVNLFDQNDPSIESEYGSGAEVEVDNSIGYFIGGGLDIFLTRHVAVSIDAKYIWNEFEMDVPGSDDAEFDLDMLVIGGGLKYCF